MLYKTIPSRTVAVRKLFDYLAKCTLLVVLTPRLCKHVGKTLFTYLLQIGPVSKTANKFRMYKYIRIFIVCLIIKKIERVYSNTAIVFARTKLD